MEDFTHKSGLTQEESQLLVDSSSSDLWDHPWPRLTPHTPTNLKSHQLVQMSLMNQSQDIQQNHFPPNVRFNLKVSVADLRGAVSNLSPLQRVERRTENSSCSEGRGSCARSKGELEADQDLAVQQRQTASSNPKKKNSLQKQLRNIQESEEFQLACEVYLGLDWEAVTREEFLGYSKNSLISTSALQHYLSSAPTASAMENLAIDTFEELVYDQFGCQVIRILLRKSDKVKSYVLDYFSQRDFKAMCVHQFASKVMQTAAEVCEAYRIDCLQQIISNWEDLKCYILTTYLFRIFLENTKNTDPSFSVAANWMLSKCEDIFSERYNKRFLVSFIEHCSRRQLAMVYTATQMETVLETRGNDKYVVFAFVTFIKRRYKKAEDYLVWLLKQSNVDLTLLKKALAPITVNIRASLATQIRLLLK